MSYIDWYEHRHQKMLGGDKERDVHLSSPPAIWNNLRGFVYYPKTSVVSKQIQLRLLSWQELLALMNIIVLVVKLVDVVEKLCFQGKIRWIAQVISHLLEITKASFFRIEPNMLFQGGKLSLGVSYTFHYFNTVISRNSLIHTILLVIYCY